MSSTLDGLSSYYTSDYWQSTQSTQQLEKTLESDVTDKSDEELMDVCKDFESYLVEQMFKAMEKMVPEDEDGEDDYTKMFGDTMIQELAKTSTEQNSLGIAQKLYEQMKRNYNL